MKVMVTGHRPNKLGGYNNLNVLNQLVVAELDHRLDALHRAHDNLVCCSGMALGVDQWWAKLCNDHHIPWIAFVPCAKQWAKWPDASRLEWERIIKGATEVRQVSSLPYFNGCMQARNAAMVKWADHCVAVWDGTPGGTGHAVRLVKACGLSVDVIDVNKLRKEVENDRMQSWEGCGVEVDAKTYYCTVCGKNPVDAKNGYDTCQECLDKAQYSAPLRFIGP